MADFSGIDIPLEILDFKRTCEQVGDDTELAIEILELFINHAPTRVNEMIEGLESRDASMLRKAAHTLKGSSSNIFAEGVRSASLKIEKAADAGDMGEIPGLIDNLNDELNKIRDVYKKLKQE